MIITSLVAGVARRHPACSEEQVAAIGKSFAEEWHLELCQRSLGWRESRDPGAAYREAESRAIASLVYALGEVR